MKSEKTFKLIGPIIALTVMATMLLVIRCFASEAQPIKIGFLAPLTGVLADNGDEMRKGFELYLKQIGHKAAGKKIEAIVADDEAKPAVGITKVHELVEREKVNLLGGIVHSGVALAVRDYVHSHKIPLVLGMAGAKIITQDPKIKSHYIYRSSTSAPMADFVGGWYAYTKLGFRKAIVSAPDYVAGHDEADGFMKFFKQLGGKVVLEIYPPFGAADYGPYLSKIVEKAKEADVFWCFFSGTEAVRFVKQYADYGLKEKLTPFLGGFTLEEGILPAIGDVALGIKTYVTYSRNIDNPENRSFVSAYKSEYKSNPGEFSEEGYVVAKVYIEAIKAANGDLSNIDRFVEALGKVKFNAPRGPFRFDKDHNAVRNIYIGEVGKDTNGELSIIISEVMPGVHQYWTPPK
jgi:branched-chain amino acid transport system substrate-binding protein